MTGLLEVDLHLTNRCNLACWHCSVDSARTPYGEMTLADWETVVDDVADAGCDRVDLTGGEPMLYQGIEALVARIVTRGLSVELQTNGLLATPDRLGRLRDAGLETLIVSIDGERDRHDEVRGRAGTFDAARSAIEYATQLGMRVRVTRVVVGEQDADDRLLDFARSIDDLGVSHLSINLFSPVTPSHFATWSPPDAERWLAFCDHIEDVARTVSFPITYEVAFARPHELAEYLGEETRCLIQRRAWLLVRADGEVFPCYHFVHRPEMSIGNVRTHRIGDLVGSGNAAWTRYDELDRVPSGCQDCAHSTTCGGGCPSPGYLQIGSLAVKDVRCQVEQGHLPVCPFIKRTAGTRYMTNISPYYHSHEQRP